MSYHVLISIVVVIAGITSLYLLLALFQNYLPTQAASEVRKLSKVAQAPFPQLRRESQEVSQSTHILNQGDARRERFSRTSLVKNLRHGAWSMSPMLFHLYSLSVSIGVAAAVASIADPFVIPFALLSGPLSMRLALRRSIEQRTRRFSNDYPQFLMTTVSLLKTGMTPSGALQEAALGLESESLVRKEVLSMIERIRVGMSEEKSIGGFAETIAHPEIELFVQSLLLGLRMGGELSGLARALV
jgi:Flp pilus assembly protein TadB